MEENRLAIIGGSQAYNLVQKGCFSGERISAVNTPFGESQPIFRLHIDEGDVLLMSRHGEKGYSIAPSWVNYRANIWALKSMGVQKIVSWSGPGAIDEQLKIGQFVVPDDIIDETKNRRYSFFEGLGIGFVRQNPVFCPSLSKVITSTLEELGQQYKLGGTYVCTEGPRLETPAEIKKYKLIGADMVGMTLVPEVFLAKELEMCYASTCYITNYAEGIRARDFKPGLLFEGLLDSAEKEAVDAAVNEFPNIIKVLVGKLNEESTCHCDRLMERYRKRGDIGSDWKTWINKKP